MNDGIQRTAASSEENRRLSLLLHVIPDTAPQIEPFNPAFSLGDTSIHAQRLTTKHIHCATSILAFGLVVRIWHSVSYCNKRTWTTYKCELVFDPNHANWVNKKTAAESEQVQVPFTTYRFINKVGNIPTDRIRSVHWLSWNVYFTTTCCWGSHWLPVHGR